MDVGFGYFLVKSDLAKDREKILIGGPWMFGDYYVAVKPWSATFQPNEKSFGSTPVWIRIVSLNILYYQERAMRKIASGIRTPIKIDLATKEAKREKFARACVQIDLDLLMVSKIIVDGAKSTIEYENLDLICEKCNCFGHVKEYCTEDRGVKEDVEPTVTASSQPVSLAEGRESELD
ncbi:uncharacterized protein [Arachis hypogaea]|uniref:uncharacterized protein n=1 Tax=Arachis hypogaea TaxID=3818 RepID=UPI000DECD06E|nr:uncharacterized protein LOC112717941 [Arachis hypogaea]